MKSVSDDDVVITGRGAVTPIGVGVDDLWGGLMERRSGAGAITLFDASGSPVRIACEVDAFDPYKYLETREVRRTDRLEQLGVAAAVEAIDESGGPDFGVSSDRVGVIVSCGGIGFLTYESQYEAVRSNGPRHASPFMPIQVMPSGTSGLVALRHGFMGPSYAVSSACATGANSIGDAYLLLKAGMADVMIAGGTDCAISKLWVAAFARMGALSRRNDDPARASRPFDARRDGFVIAEGAGVLVLERRKTAEKRGAKILAQLTGYGMSTDAYHMTAPRPDGAGAQLAMRNALDAAHIEPSDVSYISAHGTGTPLNDCAETRAIRALFGVHANATPVVASKSQLGHSLGAAAGFQAVIAVLSIDENVIPSTINLQTPDPECDLDYVPEGPREGPVAAVLINSFGFGGHNVCLVVEDDPHS